MVLQRKMVGKDQQDPALALLHEANERHHCAMQSALQQSPHASVTRECHKHCQVPMSPKIFTWQKTWNVARCISPCSIGCKQHYLQTEKTWQHSTAEATAHSLLAKIFFSRQQMVLHAYSKICAVQAKTYQAETYLALKESQWRSCEQRRFHRVWHPAGACSNASDMQRKRSTKTWTKHRTTLTAKKVVYQKLKRLVCTLPVGSRILGQRLTKYLLSIRNHKAAKTFSQLVGPVSQLLNEKETKTDAKNQRVYMNNYMNTSKII